MEFYQRQLGTSSIPNSLYTKTADKLMDGLREGLGGLSFDYGDNRAALAAHMRHNIYSFSAAKSITEMQVVNSLLIDPETGNARSWAAFRDAVRAAGIQFNENHLQAEHNNVINNAHSALEWENLSDQEFLEFRTAEDDHVRPSHAALDHMTARRDSQVFYDYFTPLDWKCRCHWIPGIAANLSNEHEFGKRIKAATNPKGFKNNPGRSQTVFMDDMPYFQQAKKEGIKNQLFQAEKNYGMPGLEKIYTRHDLPDFDMHESEDQYRAAWSEMPKVEGTDNVLIKDILGQNILFDSWDTSKKGSKSSFFKDHILDKQKEKRFGFGNLFPYILQDPDEIWSQMQNGHLVIYHLKYYENGPLVVMTNADESLKAESMYMVNKQNLDRIRQGALLFRK